MGQATRSQVLNLRNARKVAFASYETAIARRRDTVLIVIGLAVLFGGSVLWEVARQSTVWGPHWFLIVFIILGIRAAVISFKQVDLEREHLRAVAAMGDDMNDAILASMDSVDEQIESMREKGVIEYIQDNPSNGKASGEDDTPRSPE